MRGIRSRSTPKGENEGDQIQVHTQEIGGIRSRSTPKREIEAHTQGEIEGDQIQAHTQGEIEGDQIQVPPPPPREADLGIRSMSGRYASYWNAFLFHSVFEIFLNCMG